MTDEFKLVWSSKKVGWFLIFVSLILGALTAPFFTAEAASTGVIVNSTSLTTKITERVNFLVSTIKQGDPTKGTYISVTDNGAGGNFFDSNGDCNQTTPDSDNKFDIINNKNVCYSNGVPGNYVITVQLLDGKDGNPIGVTTAINVTVTETISGSGQGGAGAIWTNIGPCGSPQNVNQYEVGEDFFGHGHKFTPNTTYTWIVKDPGKNGATIETGTVTTDATGNFCEKLFTITEEHIGGPYQFNVGDSKNDNFSVRLGTHIADLSVVKTVGTTTPYEGTDVTYTLTITNNGPDTATGVVVTDLLATGLTYKSATVAPAFTSPLTWNVGTLTNGASWIVDVVATVGADQGGLSIVNTAVATSTVNDPINTNNSDSVTILPVDVTNQVFGCTDADATNHNSAATVDDGSCLFALMVNKVMAGNTTATPDQFSFTVNGVSTTTFNASGTAMIAVPNGTYGVVEVPTLGFIASSHDCAQIVVNGASASCTITNTPEDQVVYGTLMVVKNVVGESEPNYANFSFTVNGVATTTFVTGNTVTLTVSTGIYTVSELSVAGYDVSYSNCVAVPIIANATTTCTITNKVQNGPPAPEVDTYRVEGYVWHDDNRNTLWDGFNSEDENELIENSLTGWTVNITNASTSFSTSTVTDANGYYFFDVPAGTWIITEVVQSGWERTTQESHVVTVPEVPEYTWFDSLRNFFIPTAHAALLASYGDFNFGNDTVDLTTPTITTNTSGGGGGRSNGNRPRPQVLGVTNTPLPTPLVLGEQISIVPVGAPNTGHGGDDSSNLLLWSLALGLYMIVFTSSSRMPRPVRAGMNGQK